MTNITWIIDKHLFDEYEKRLTESIEKSGSKYFFYDNISVMSFEESVTSNFSDKEIIIFHGSLQHGRKISKLPVYPGVFMTIENYECYNYYGYFGNYLLNANYSMMGLNDVLRNKDNIFFNYGTDKIFIRPSNGYKTFAGQVLHYENFESEFNILVNSYGGIPMNTLVVIAPFQEIVDEYRFIIIDDEVVSGSQYFDKENTGTFKPYYDKACIDKEVIYFANEMSKVYQPDKAYTIDICRTSLGKLKLLELNSFNCASMYGNDYYKIVESANKLAIKEYNDLFNF
jgi:hypothetical protein